MLVKNIVKNIKVTNFEKIYILISMHFTVLFNKKSIYTKTKTRH